MDKRNRDIDLLKRIITYCVKIQKAKDRFGASFKDFQADCDYQSSCAMYILQIGELSNRLSDGLKSRRNDIPWRDITGMRNIFAHEYEDFNTVKVWETLRDDIEPLREKCVQILLELEPDSDPEDDNDELLIEDDEDDE